MRFRLVHDVADETGATLRQHLTQGGQEVEDPEPLDAPWILDWFWSLSNRRGPRTEAGLAPISWESIDAWVRTSGSGAEPWEIGVIEQLDNVFVGELGRPS